MTFERISIDHQVIGGMPCSGGTRIPVATVVGMVAEGLTPDEILADFPRLTLGDIHEALRYAAAAVDERELPLPPQWLGRAGRAPQVRHTNAAVVYRRGEPFSALGWDTPLW